MRNIGQIMEKTANENTLISNQKTDWNQKNLKQGSSHKII